MKRTLLSVLGSAILVPTSRIFVFRRARAILTSLFLLIVLAGIGVSPANAATNTLTGQTCVINSCDYAFDFTLGGGSVPFSYSLTSTSDGFLDISVWVDPSHNTPQPWSFTFGFTGDAFDSLDTFELKAGQTGVSFFIASPGSYSFIGNWVDQPDEDGLFPIIFPVTGLPGLDPHGFIQFTDSIPTGFSQAQLTPLPATLPL